MRFVAITLLVALFGSELSSAGEVADRYGESAEAACHAALPVPTKVRDIRESSYLATGQRVFYVDAEAIADSTTRFELSFAEADTGWVLQYEQRSVEVVLPGKGPQWVLVRNDSLTTAAVRSAIAVALPLMVQDEIVSEIDVARVPGGTDSNAVDVDTLDESAEHPCGRIIRVTGVGGTQQARVIGQWWI